MSDISANIQQHATQTRAVPQWVIVLAVLTIVIMIFVIKSHSSKEKFASNAMGGNNPNWHFGGQNAGTSANTGLGWEGAAGGPTHDPMSPQYQQDGCLEMEPNYSESMIGGSFNTGMQSAGAPCDGSDNCCCGSCGGSGMMETMASSPCDGGSCGHPGAQQEMMAQEALSM